jgi:two-component system sensor histidine kinase UhpB
MKYVRQVLLPLLQGISIVAAGQLNPTDSLLNVVRENRRDPAEVKALNALAAGFARTDLPKAKTFLYESIELASVSKFYPQLAAAYSQMVSYQQDLGRTDSASWYLDRLKQLSGSNPEYRINYVQAAGLYYKRQQNLKAALPFLLESLDKATAASKADSSLSKRTAVAGANLNVGNTYVDLGDYRTALQYHLTALRLFEQVANRTGIAFAYQMIGGDFLQLNQLQQASAYTAKSMVLKAELNDTRGIMTAFKQMGTIFKDADQPDSALEYYGKALGIDQKLGLKVEEMNLDLDLGMMYKDRKDLVNAGLYFQNGKSLSVQLGDSLRTANFDAALVSIRSAGKDQQLTEQRLVNSLNAAIRTGDKESELLAYQYLADHYAGIGQAKKAMEYDRKYFEMSDSLQRMDVQLQLQKMEGQYNVDKKEREIALLKKDQQLDHLNLEKQQATLAKQKTFQYGAMVVLLLLLLIGFLVINRYRLVHRTRRAIELEKMRNHIARDLHDDIGSTLSSINILSKVALQSPDSSTHGSLTKIRDHSADIMEKMDDIVWTIHPQNDSLEQLFYRMREFAAEILDPLNINYSFEEEGDFSSFHLDIRKRKDLYLLFKEAVNNAAKYSQCANLRIRLLRAGDSLELEIADDGKGFAEEGIRGGNGLNNMRERAASMLGRLRIDSAIGQGTRIDLVLPIT